MPDNFNTLLEETNAISLRTTVVMDDGNLVTLRLMPAWLESSIPRKRMSAPKDLEWVNSDFAYLYRHIRSTTEEKALMNGFPCVDQEVKPMRFGPPPNFRLLWADSGNGVALFLNEEPWAFIDEETQQGYSKGLVGPPKAQLSVAGNRWDQALFDNLFSIS